MVILRLYLNIEVLGKREVGSSILPRSTTTKKKLKSVHFLNLKKMFYLKDAEISSTACGG